MDFAGFISPVQGNTVNFGNGASLTLTVECNFGDFAIGGGFYTLASGSCDSFRPVPAR